MNDFTKNIAQAIFDQDKKIKTVNCNNKLNTYAV